MMKTMFGLEVCGLMDGRKAAIVTMVRSNDDNTIAMNPDVGGGDLRDFDGVCRQIERVKFGRFSHRCRRRRCKKKKKNKQVSLFFLFVLFCGYFFFIYIFIFVARIYICVCVYMSDIMMCAHVKKTNHCRYSQKCTVKIPVHVFIDCVHYTIYDFGTVYTVERRAPTRLKDVQLLLLLLLPTSCRYILWSERENGHVRTTTGVRWSYYNT